MYYLLGVDLGGSKTEIVVLSLATEHLSEFDNLLSKQSLVSTLQALPTFNECYRFRQPTPAYDYDLILNSIVDLVDGALDFLLSPAQQNLASTNFSDKSHLLAYCRLGVGMPGAIDVHGRVKNANTQCLNGRPFKQDLQAKLAQPLAQSLAVSNDANCFALSEAVDGAAQEAVSLFGVIIGTGVGGAVVLNHQLQEGVNRLAGEWGHIPMPMRAILSNELQGFHLSDRACYCGKENCIETFLNGQGLLTTFAELCDYYRSNDQHSSNGSVPELMPQLMPQRVEELLALAEQGSELAKTALAFYSLQLAEALASIINILDPEMIVLGGGLSQLPGLCGQVQSHLSSLIFSSTQSELCLTQIACAQFGDSSGVRGAAFLPLLHTSEAKAFGEKH